MKEIIIGKDIKDSKEKAWIELGKKFGANKLYVLGHDEEYPAISGTTVHNKIGYQLSWQVDEDDIHVCGSGTSGNAGRIGLSITVDETLFCRESHKVLADAMKCLEHIDKNRKKYFH